MDSRTAFQEAGFHLEMDMITAFGVGCDTIPWWGKLGVA